MKGEKSATFSVLAGVRGVWRLGMEMDGGRCEAGGTCGDGRLQPYGVRQSLLPLFASMTDVIDVPMTLFGNREI